MQNNSSNPLAKHFRQPALYIKLPSSGKFWPDGSLDLPLNGEIPVYPMTAKDEIMIRTPDALLNGAGTVSVIQSCCPNILDAWNMPSVDLDTVLIAIRIASYGPTMDVSTKCPKCDHSNEVSVPLQNCLESIRMPDFDTGITLDELRFKLKPQSYFRNNRTAQINFEQQQSIRAISDPNIPDDQRQTVFNEHLEKLVSLNIESFTETTQSITLSDGTRVDDPEYIREFYNNADNRVFKALQAYIVELSQDLQIKPFKLQCEECKHEFDFTLTFDWANFFDNGF
jgi:hypothetical protein